MGLTKAQKARIYGKTKPKYKVGDWVTYPRIPEPVPVLVIEHCGPLGTDGEHIYRLRRVFDWGEIREFQQPESVLHPTEAPPTNAPAWS